MTRIASQLHAASQSSAIVLGAADGIGLAFARALALAGARLALVDRDEIALARLRHEIDAVAIRCDVLDERSVAAMFDAAESAIGPANLLINAAGSGYVRTLGVMRSSREFARRPRHSKAIIVNIAAGAGEAFQGFQYAGSEVAFSRLAEGLARAIEAPDLRIVTLQRIETTEAAADLAQQLVRELSGATLGSHEDGDTFRLA